MCFIRVSVRLILCVLPIRTLSVCARAYAHACTPDIVHMSVFIVHMCVFIVHMCVFIVHMCVLYMSHALCAPQFCTRKIYLEPEEPWSTTITYLSLPLPPPASAAAVVGASITAELSEEGAGGPDVLATDVADADEMNIQERAMSAICRRTRRPSEQAMLAFFSLRCWFVLRH